MFRWLPAPYQWCQCSVVHVVFKPAHVRDNGIEPVVSIGGLYNLRYSQIFHMEMFRLQGFSAIKRTQYVS